MELLDLRKYYYKKLLTIRLFEENLLRLFSENKLFGTTHTCIGQEAVAVAAMEHITEQDKIFSNHRCHGHFIAYSMKPELLLKEIMGKQGGMCGGRGGSQHIHYKNFYTNGIQGGIVPNAVGMGWAEKLKGTNNIAIVFIGDGTLGQGVVYESMNIASLKEIPVLFIVENNEYAMSTKVSDGVAGSIVKRAEAFGIEASEIHSNDIEELCAVFKDSVESVRNKKKPFLQVVHTYRLAAHSKGDDFRNPQEVAEHRKNDPLILIENKLPQKECEEIRKEIQRYIQSITQSADKEDASNLPLWEVERQSVETCHEGISKYKFYVEAINDSLSAILAENPQAVLLGEDISDGYGGAFKVTKGLSTAYAARVFNMPISEAAIVGVSVGLALNGILPIAEIMFGDFVSLAFDQILNHASKYPWVYGNGLSLPVVLRMPMGGKRGYGPTHSQTLDKYLIGIPGIKVVALSILHDPRVVYGNIVNNIECLTIVIENKELYSKKPLEIKKGKLNNFFVQKMQNHLIPTFLLSLNSNFSAEYTFITYGGMVTECMQAAIELMIEDEIEVNIIILGQLAEIPFKDIMEIKDKIGHILTIEEGNKTMGVGAEIIALLKENAVGGLCSRIAAKELPIPNSILLEKDILPCKKNIIEKVRSLHYGG